MLLKIIIIVLQIITLAVVFSIKDKVKETNLDPIAQRIIAVEKNFSYADAISRDKRAELIKLIIEENKK
jgi:hypothetical protein